MSTAGMGDGIPVLLNAPWWLVPVREVGRHPYPEAGMVVEVWNINKFLIGLVDCVKRKKKERRQQEAKAPFSLSGERKGRRVAYVTWIVVRRFLFSVKRFGSRLLVGVCMPAWVSAVSQSVENFTFTTFTLALHSDTYSHLTSSTKQARTGEINPHSKHQKRRTGDRTHTTTTTTHRKKKKKKLIANFEYYKQQHL